MLREYCKDQKVPYEECGTLVIARDESERATLETLLGWGSELNVPGLRMISKGELMEREPNVPGDANCPLFSLILP